MDKMAFAQRAFAEQGMMSSTTSSYTEMILRGEQPVVPVEETASQEEDDMGPVSGPKILSLVELAHNPHRYTTFFTLHLLTWVPN